MITNKINRRKKEKKKRRKVKMIFKEQTFKNKKMEEEENAEESNLVTTVGCGLKRILGSQKDIVRPMIEDAVRRSTLSLFKASLLLNTHMLRMCEDGLIPDINQTFCCQAQNLVTDGNRKPRKTNEAYLELEKTYDIAIKPFEEKCRVSGIGMAQIRASNAIMMVTNFNIYLKDALKAHQRRYLELKYNLNRTQSDWMVQRIRSPNPTFAGKTFLSILKKHNWSEATLLKKILFESIIYFPVQKACSNIQKAEKVKYEDKKAKKDAFSNVMWLLNREKTLLRFKMLRKMDSIDPDCTKGRRFSLFPIHSLQRKFIRIDIKTIRDLDREKKLGFLTKGQIQKKIEKGETVKEPGLSDIFNLKSIRKLRSKEWKDKVTSVLTNGYEAFTMWSASERREKREASLSSPLVLPNSVDLKDIIGIDPGNHSVITSTCTCGNKDNCEHFSVSKCEYYRNCGFTKRLWKQLKAKKNTDHGKRVLSYETLWSLKTLRTTDWEKMMEANQERLRWARAIASFYLQRKWADLRFSCRQKKMREIERIANRIGKNGKYIAFGDAKFAVGMRGCSPGAGVGSIRKCLQRKYPAKFINCNEYNTSKNCSCCGEKLKQFIGRTSKVEKEKMVKQGKDEKQTKRVHGLRWCKTCHKTWNRDVNASLNISLVALNILNGIDERPCHLRRKNTVDHNKDTSAFVIL